MSTDEPGSIKQWGVPLPFSIEEATRFGTPVWLYRSSVIEQRFAEVSLFDVVRYAQKALPNIAILDLIRRLGGVVDAVSAGEISRALHVGFDPKAKIPGVVYTADLFDDEALRLIAEHSIPVNVGSPDMLEQLAAAKISVPVTLRINPGFGHGHSRKTNTGGELSKHGIWHEEIESVIARGRELGLNLQGLHLHIGSGTDLEHLSKLCDSMIDASRRFGPGLRTISAGGGLPISYEKGERATEPIDLRAYYQLWDQARKVIEAEQGRKISLEIEPGRYIVAESGYLISKIRSIKKQGNHLFYLVDAGFNDLIRPAFYGSHHQISIIPADQRLLTNRVEAIIAGPLCESADVFTQEDGGYVVKRSLPEARVGDYLVLHDAGAYGSSMSSNYNSRPLAAELLEVDGKLVLIRQRQKLEELYRNERIPH